MVLEDRGTSLDLKNLVSRIENRTSLLAGASKSMTSASLLLSVRLQSRLVNRCKEGMVMVMVEMEKRMNLAHRPSDRSGEDRGKSGELP
jgi:hypothetical protein